VVLFSRFVCTLCVLVLTSTAFVNSAQSASFGPLLADPAPKRTTRSNHYVVSNERRHHLFHRAIKDKGGVFTGVGTDQLYIIAGWMKPQILVPMDFDQYVVDLHMIYKVVFISAKTPSQFMTLFQPSQKSKLKGLIKSAYPDAKRYERYVRVLGFSLKTVANRFKRVKRHYERLKLPVFLTDQASYDFIRKMHQEDRVVPVRGDLTKDKAMQSIAAAARKANLTVRGVYLSNAEQYFPYRQQYRDNFLGMPFDDQSVILRTIPDGKKGYYYYTQSGLNFQKWMRAKHIGKVWGMLHYKTRVAGTGGRGFVIEREPPKSRKKK
jgi:hypothetical protein